MSEIDTIINAAYAAAGHSELTPDTAGLCNGYLAATESHITQKIEKIRGVHADVLKKVALRVNLKAPPVRVMQRVYSVLYSMHSAGDGGAAFAAMIDLASLCSLYGMRATYRIRLEHHIDYNMALL